MGKNCQRNNPGNAGYIKTGETFKKKSRKEKFFSLFTLRKCISRIYYYEEAFPPFLFMIKATLTQFSCNFTVKICTKKKSKQTYHLIIWNWQRVVFLVKLLHLLANNQSTCLPSACLYASLPHNINTNITYLYLDEFRDIMPHRCCSFVSHQLTATIL